MNSFIEDCLCYCRAPGITQQRINRIKEKSESLIRFIRKPNQKEKISKLEPQEHEVELVHKGESLSKVQNPIEKGFTTDCQNNLLLD